VTFVFAFDFDGVIVNSHNVLRQTYFEFLEMQGREGNEQEFLHLNGPSLKEIVGILKENYALADSTHSLFLIYRDLLWKRYMHVSLVPGITECLNELRHQQIPVALVTSAMRLEVEAVLKAADLLRVFDVIITGDDVATSKPSPEIYLKLREIFAERSIYAVEDSESGLQSAVAAGLRAIFFDAIGTGTQTQVFCRVENAKRLKHVIQGLLFNACVIETADSFGVQVMKSPQTLDKSTVSEIDRIWALELKNRPRNDDLVLYYGGRQLQDGHCLISAYLGPYRYFFAQHLDASLEISFTPLAVSGLCLIDYEWVLVGPRKKVTQYPGQREFAPSGGLSLPAGTSGEIDFVSQLIDEFESETGLEARSVESILTLGLIHDLNHNVIDIGCQMNINDAARKSLMTSDEYSSLSWENFANFQEGQLIPTSRCLFTLARSYSD